jgi:hypothetical protein
MGLNDAVLPELFRALNLVVIERQPNSTFYMVTPAPEWLTGAFAAAPAGERHTLSGAFPFLDDFLQQASGAWKAGPHASVVSGPFAASVDGDELLLRASALTIDGHALLVLERLIGAADTRPMLQKARQHLLDTEQLTRKIMKVHAPAAAIADAVGELTTSALSPAQRVIADALTAASAQLAAAVAELPEPAPVRRRGQG